MNIIRVMFRVELEMTLGIGLLIQRVDCVAVPWFLGSYYQDLLQEWVKEGLSDHEITTKAQYFR
jgi:hypothetical protein